MLFFFRYSQTSLNADGTICKNLAKHALREVKFISVILVGLK